MWGVYMLGLPKSTELSRQLPKKALYAKFNMNTVAKEKFDADIKRITIVNEISTNTTTIGKGEQIAGFYVLLVSLKQKDFDEKTISQISKLINQNILLILEYKGQGKLAIYYKHLIQAKWKLLDELTIELKGLNLDSVWENIVIQVGEIQIEKGNTLEEQIELEEKRLKLQKQLAHLEKQARAERQPQRKFALVQQIKKLEKQLEDR